MSGALHELLEDARLLVFVGEGGVGKTSTAAAAALAAGEAGRRVAVLTVDPAPRLGNALGLGRFDEHPRPVGLSAQARPGGEVLAMRLDTKGTFDRMVRRFAPSDAEARAVLDNPIYTTISGSLGGSESYMAFQRLYELTREDDYDLLVVDTPPALHAAELLSAPLRLSALLETGAASVLANPAVVVAHAGSAVAKTTARVLLSLLERLTGIDLRRQVAEFIESFEHVLVGLSERAGAIESLLRAADTAFVEVARPRPLCIQAAIALERELAQAEIEVDAIVVNRMTPPAGADRVTRRRERLACAPAGTAEAVAAMERDLDGLRAAEAGAVAMLRESFALRPPREQPIVVEVASLDHDVASVDDLRTLGRALEGAA